MYIWKVQKSMEKYVHMKSIKEDGNICTYEKYKRGGKFMYIWKVHSWSRVAVAGKCLDLSCQGASLSIIAQVLDSVVKL